MLTEMSCFVGPIIGPGKVLLSTISFSLALISLFILKRFNLSTRLKVSFIYVHLTTLIFPFVLFGTHVGCGVACMSCYTNIPLLVSYALPTTLFFSTIIGFFVIPSMYIFSNKNREIKNKQIISFIKRYSKILDIQTPKVYALDKAKPVAFSFKTFKSAIFLSVGLMEILNKKEVKSVLLHELAHIYHKSSVLKFSSCVMRLLSPLSILVRFHHDSNKEEELADEFVRIVQKTDRHLKSAKRKIDRYGRLL